MNTDKRNFSDFSNKESFPGCVDITTGEFLFYALYHVDSSGNKRIWEIKVRLIKGNPKSYKVDWDLMLDDTIPVKQSYLENTKIPVGSHAQIWVETGVIGGKITRHAPSYPTMTNEGKANERNVFEQGLVDARTLYLKKIANGFKTELNFKNKKASVKEKNIKYFPMLVRKFVDEKKHIQYPVYVQPKLDGVRCITFLNKNPKKNPTIKNVIMYSRQRKIYSGFDDIKTELLPALIDMWDFGNNETIYVDGELYKHGMDLQTISGAVRNAKRDTIPKYKGIKYWIFDVFYPSSLDLIFDERIECLHDLFDSIGDNPKHLIEVGTHIAKTEQDQEKIYKQYLKKKYEGTILRNYDSLYLTDSSKNSAKIRSKFVLKRKMRFTDEFELVDFTQGIKGKDIGAVIWILKTHDTNKTFNATPKDITYEERYKLYKKAVSNNKKGFNNNYKGRMMTVEYEDLSKDKVPLRAKSIWFREHL
jgi:ATP-dependent DNA ligase